MFPKQVGDKVVHRYPPFLYQGADGEVIKVVKGQPLFLVRWSDGYAMWERLHSMDMLEKVA
tara:strand:+ start:126 stop:308 length:183 start_codon:yes stop_codon:yes gene_type:complete